MRKIYMAFPLLAMLSSCGLYSNYSRPEDISTDNLYGTQQSSDTNTIATLKWKEVFTDAHLQALIQQGLEHNTDLQSAHYRVKEAEASLTSAKWAYAPSFYFAPQGALSSYDGAKTAKTYSIPVTASWEVDIFSRILNGKRSAKAALRQTQAYHQAVQTQLIASIANYYYTLLMLDRQFEVSDITVKKWREYVETMKALKEAGMANESAVSQAEANCLSIEASLLDLKLQIRQTENAFSSLLGAAPLNISRGKLDEQILPENLSVGIPMQLLSNRPDVKSAEESLIQAFYATQQSRAGLYPSISINGSAGWSNSMGTMLFNPSKILLSAAGSLTQPIFNTGARTRLKISKAQQEEAKLSFQQTLLNAGVEVNDALNQTLTARSRVEIRNKQIASLETALESTQLLMAHGSSTYLEVLTAQQSLLSAQLTQISDKYSEIQGIVNLYHALGGGKE